MKTTLIISVLLLSTQLLTCQDNCYRNGYMNITDYEVSTNLVTEKGIRVDDPLFQLDLAELDRQTDALEACLEISIRRECLTVKVAPDWYISPCSDQQLFPCDINPQVCEDKGVILTEECPCNCRAMIQNETTIIVTPNLYIYRGELARMITGINNPWAEGFSHCLLD